MDIMENGVYISLFSGGKIYFDFIDCNIFVDSGCLTKLLKINKKLLELKKNFRS